MHQKFPIGIQDFRKLRKEGFVYIDKTRLIHQLVTTGHYYFLSRPRRFGKSLLVSTIKELFSGDKALFQGLWIENNWDWNTKYPVIHLKMSQIDYQSNGLYEGLNKEMQRIGTELGIDLQEHTLKNRFSELIQKAAQSGPVVILMDEYDKSIIDNLENPVLAEANQDVLKQFYSILKDADPHIRFMLVTGVSKFSKVSIFSDLNNLEDITLSAPLHDLTGITQDELNRHFNPEITEIATNTNTSEADLKDTIRQWYNGYSWGGKERLYNPFSILSFFKNQQFNNFWFETGTPSFLVELIRTAEKFELDKTEYTALLGLSEFDPKNPNFKTVLFQTGYLTIDQINLPEGWCQLKYPNKEVKDSLEQLLLAAYRYTPANEALPIILQLRNAFNNQNIEAVIELINASFASIPYPLWQGATELHYHALVHLTFSLLGAYIQSEVSSSKGRCDAIIKTDQTIYALEFKLDESADIALKQIQDQGYLTPYLHLPVNKVAIGINFSSKNKNVKEWKTQQLTTPN